MGVIIWFIAALVLAGLELAVGEFTLLMLAGGALATTGVALFGVPIWVELIVFGLSSAALIGFLRPVLKRRVTQPKALDTSPKALVGKRAEVIEEITPHSGQVRLDGTFWSARALNPMETISAGDHVTVAEIDGPTAIVWKEL
ncbi:NfeD family protein [Corynebacterium breve]|uniref:NfeD family protein n=1 Tax=Corynebacterium breve TaxID=3049799 RepID=A0ABY8VHQ3_9CORY|nr:NfeD family protein [Corynebacterium breve]WIM68862.1 NfeD family protein [Corynebacterium breve]